MLSGACIGTGIPSEDCGTFLPGAASVFPRLLACIVQCAPLAQKKNFTKIFFFYISKKNLRTGKIAFLTIGYGNNPPSSSFVYDMPT
jgi:hypothetical protein